MERAPTSPPPADNIVDQYSIDPLSGALSPKTPPFVSAGAIPMGIVVTPSGESAYVTSSTFSNPPSGTVSQYDIDPVTGELSPKTPATVATGRDPTAIAVTPDGKSVYVTNAFVNASMVSQYTVDPVTGELSPKAPATVAADDPTAIAVTPNGKSAYVTNIDNNTVSQYDIDPLTGALTPKAPATVTTAAGPWAIAVTPDGKSVYVVNKVAPNGTVSQFNVDSVTGALSPKNPATVAAGAFPTAVAIASDGKSAYVTNYDDDTVSQYDIAPRTGALTPKAPATVATGANPDAIAVSPLPRVHSTSTSVTCSPRVFAPGDATVCTATVTDTVSGTATTPTGTVSFTNSGEGRFFGSQCTLSGTGASASCAVFLTSFARGGRIIEASYGGDATHSASSGFTGVTVAVPVSTAGCVVSGHGRITAANGDKASFRGLVAALPPRGVEFYRDNGPANPFRVLSLSVDALTCNANATHASVFGTAKINSTGSVQYRIDVQLTAWEHGKDTYRIRLGNGYDSGAQQIRHSDLEIRTRSSEHHHHNANANHYKPGAGPDGG